MQPVQIFAHRAGALYRESVRRVLSIARPGWQKWSTRIALACVIAACFAYLPYRLLDGSGTRRAAGVDRELRATHASIHALELSNARLLREVGALKNDPGAIEEIARHQLGMVRAGELVIRVARSSEVR